MTQTPNTEPTVTKKPNRTRTRTAASKTKRIEVPINENGSLPTVAAQQLLGELLSQFSVPQQEAIVELTRVITTPGTDVYTSGYKKAVRYLAFWAKNRAVSFSLK